jgi:predicted metal-dependent hydrolase
MARGYHALVSPEEQKRLLGDGRAAFNRGEFYDAHEHWEEVWNEIDDPDRRWIQGLIQVATGLHKLQRERIDSARTLLARALDKLADAPETWQGLAVGALRRAAEATARALERGERPDPASLRLDET